MSSPRVAVVGAGMAGLACATGLQEAGFHVTVFDKSSGPAGRMSTRRGDGWQCDHGAQYFTARDPAFRAEVSRWQEAGVAALWHPRVHLIDGQGKREIAARNERFVGIPRMTAPAFWLARNLSIQAGVTVTGLSRAGAGWRLSTSSSTSPDTIFDVVVVALPAPQAAALLRELAPAQAAHAESAVMFGCWAVMVRFATPVRLEFDAVYVNQGPLRWVARDSSKPGREGLETWLLHASPEWSQTQLDSSAGQIAVPMLDAFKKLGAPEPDAWSAHRWRYASTWPGTTPPSVWTRELGLGMCGDWLAGGTVEAAWLSGRALAANIGADVACQR